MSAAPGSLETLRGLNRGRVLQTVQRLGTASRLDIVRATGLSRSTVSSLVGELLADALLVEQPEPMPSASSSGGRPAMALTLNPRGGGVLGMHFAHDSVRVALADLSGTILADSVRELDVDHRAAEALGYAADTAIELLGEESMTIGRIAGCGVAVSAPVRPDSPALSTPLILSDWNGVDVRAELRDRLGTAVWVDNDANLGAVAEWTFGAGRGCGNMIYVMLSDGVGGGLIINGHLYEGATNTAGELGHVVVDPDGLVCRCGGRGCLETVAGGRALISALSHQYGSDTTLDDVVRLACEGDVGATRVIEDAGRAVGQALAGICMVFDPGLVVAGGKAAGAGEPLLRGIRETVRRHTSPSISQGVKVVAGMLGARAEVLGAIALVGSRTPSCLLPLS
ncbi:transcriptional regulator [Planotetraspora thailandica]|uniref:Transcriptional regulator n=1 Tax=Planotetraspora thailandica TaxID=487172 RepID=A0A8J3Y104_9ACTN|nr:ROK family transcriptional regulator [Planotetraspora thailandica]GII58824.1 transcriptional regulator [Planotetraspora thailandica]